MPMSIPPGLVDDIEGRGSLYDREQHEGDCYSEFQACHIVSAESKNPGSFNSQAKRGNPLIGCGSLIASYINESTMTVCSGHWISLDTAGGHWISLIKRTHPQ